MDSPKTPEGVLEVRGHQSSPEATQHAFLSDQVHNSINQTCLSNTSHRCSIDIWRICGGQVKTKLFFIDPAWTSMDDSKVQVHELK